MFATSFKGNADSADKLLNSRTITISGDVSGSVDFDGSGNVNLAATVIDGSHHHNTQYYTQAECNSNFVSVAGDVITGALQFSDGVKVQLGTDQDLDFYHGGSNGFIDNKTGIFYIKSNGETSLACEQNGMVWLYYDNTWRARTTDLGLEVNGIFQGEATTARYADLAENLSCAEEMVYPGTVMKFCEVGEFDVEECGTEFARNIAGVVSENPAYLMNSEQKGVPVAYTGKVRVRVKGPIGKGQPIVPAGMGIARGILKDSELLYSFGCTLESNESEEEKLVMCVVK